MSRQAPLVSVVAAAILAVLDGMPAARAVLPEARGQRLAQYWKGVATEIEVSRHRRQAVGRRGQRHAAAVADEPQRPKEVWNLTLEEAIQIALRTTR